MKKKKMFLGFFGLAAVVAGIIGRSAAVKRRSDQAFDDSVVTTKVKSALAVDDLLMAAEIDVETVKGHVQLRGAVDSQDIIMRATDIVKGIDGVRSVSNDLVVKSV